jgi:hypothetical protein
MQLLDLGNNLDAYRGNIIAKVEAIRPHGGGMIDKLGNLSKEVQEKIEKPEVAATTQATQPADEVAGAIAKEAAARTGEPRVVTEQTKASLPNPATQPTRDNPLPVAVVEPRPSPLAMLGQYLGLALAPLGTAGIVIVFVIFMLLSREDLRNRIVRLASGSGGQLTIATQALDDASNRVSRYLLAQAIVNGTYGIAVSLGLWIIGIWLGRNDPSGTDDFPSFVLWGLMCALLRFIPYIGPWIGASMPLLVALAVYKGFGVFGATIVMFVVIELISNNFMEPWLYGSSTGISTVAVLVSAVFWTWLWGPIGLLLSTPLTVVLVVIGKYIPQLAFLDILLGDEPVLDPQQQLYQRLLALDSEEATELVRAYREEMPLDDVYDTVLLPTLALAESDRHRGRLDTQRIDFIHQSMRDIIDELGEEENLRALRRSAKETEEVAKDQRAVADVEPPTSLPAGCEVNVVCLPAHDEADELVNLMLAQLLTQRRYCVTQVGVAKLASEMVNTVDHADAHVVIVSALPPSAVAHSRYLCKRVHGRFPDKPMVVGLWRFKGDMRKATARIACGDQTRMTTTLRGALVELQQVAAPFVANANAANANAAK